MRVGLEGEGMVEISRAVLGSGIHDTLIAATAQGSAPSAVVSMQFACMPLPLLIASMMTAETAVAMSCLMSAEYRHVLSDRKGKAQHGPHGQASSQHRKVRLGQAEAVRRTCNSRGFDSPKPPQSSGNSTDHQHVTTCPAIMTRPCLHTQPAWQKIGRLL